MPELQIFHSFAAAEEAERGTTHRSSRNRGSISSSRSSLATGKPLVKLTKGSKGFIESLSSNGVDYLVVVGHAAPKVWLTNNQG